MYHSGIGGGGFVLVRDSEGNYEAVDFRESAPAAAFQDMYQGNVNGSIYGGLSVAVPSEVRGLDYIHTKYGVCAPRYVRNSFTNIPRFFRGKRSCLVPFVSLETDSEVRAKTLPRSLMLTSPSLERSHTLCGSHG